MSYMEMAKIIQEARPELARNMPTRTLPDFMVKVCFHPPFHFPPILITRCGYIYYYVFIATRALNHFVFVVYMPF